MLGTAKRPLSRRSPETQTIFWCATWALCPRGHRSEAAFSLESPHVTEVAIRANPSRSVQNFGASLYACRVLAIRYPVASHKVVHEILTLRVEDWVFARHLPRRNARTVLGPFPSHAVVGKAFEPTIRASRNRNGKFIVAHARRVGGKASFACVAFGAPICSRFLDLTANCNCISASWTQVGHHAL